MSIFDIDSIQRVDEKIIESQYNLEYDFVAGKKIIKGLFLKTTWPRTIECNFETSYYGFQFLLQSYIQEVFHGISANAFCVLKKKSYKGKIWLSSLDESNLKVRFRRLLEDYGKIQYKDRDYYAVDFYDRAESGLRHKATSMIYNYIKFETQNAKYFVKDESLRSKHSRKIQ